MHNKNNNKTQTFIQGLRPFSSSIPKTLKKHLRKGGYNYSNVVDNWTRMVSKKISDKCYPNSIKSEKGGKGATLVLNVIHGKEMEVEYIKNDIISKINSFYGYNFIHSVTLKIVHDKIDHQKKILPKIKDFQRVQDKIKKVNNLQLKKHLNNFLKAYNEKNG